MTEKNLQKRVMKYLKSIPDCFTTTITPGPYGKRGISDLLICYKGRFIAIELKVKGNKPTALQTAYLDNVEGAGGEAYVCFCLDEVKEIFETREER